MRLTQRFLRPFITLVFPLGIVFLLVWLIYQLLIFFPCFDHNDSEYKPPADFISQFDHSYVEATNFKRKKEISASGHHQDISESLRKFQNLMDSVFQVMDNVRSKIDFSSRKIPTLEKGQSSRTFPFHFSNVMQVLNEYDLSHFDVLKESKYIKAYFVKTNLEYLQSFMTQDYFTVTSSNCSIIVNRSIIVPTIPIHCESNPAKSLQPFSLTLNHFKTGMPKNYKYDKNSVIVNYLYIIENGIAGHYGDIYSQDMFVVISRCSQHKDDWAFTMSPEDLAIYEEVFSVAQFWASGYFHAMIEQLPRLAPYIEYLRNRPSIKIHVHSLETFVVQIFEYLGFEKERLIAGPVRAKMLYSPAGGKCGNTPIYNAQILSYAFQQIIPRQSVKPKDIILLLKRSQKRYFSCHDSILQVLKNLAKDFNLDVDVYPDNPVPKLHTTAKMFNRAKLIVAPHGAGLSNLMFSKPGTVIIEGLCKNKDNLVNLCYDYLAHSLGMRYYGLVFDKPCWKVQAADVAPVVKFYLKYLFGK